MTTIETIAVLGAGTMGRGIAHVAAQGGYQTHLFDTQDTVLEQAVAGVHRNLDKGVERGKVDSDGAGRAKQLLTTASISRSTAL